MLDVYFFQNVTLQFINITFTKGCYRFTETKWYGTFGRKALWIWSMLIALCWVHPGQLETWGVPSASTFALLLLTLCGNGRACEVAVGAAQVPSYSGAGICSRRRGREVTLCCCCQVRQPAQGAARQARPRWPHDSAASPNRLTLTQTAPKLRL